MGGNGFGWLNFLKLDLEEKQDLGVENINIFFLEFWIDRISWQRHPGRVHWLCVLRIARKLVMPLRSISIVGMHQPILTIMFVIYNSAAVLIFEESASAISRGQNFRKLNICRLAHIILLLISTMTTCHGVQNRSTNQILNSHLPVSYIRRLCLLHTPLTCTSETIYSSLIYSVYIVSIFQNFNQFSQTSQFLLRILIRSCHWTREEDWCCIVFQKTSELAQNSILLWKQGLPDCQKIFGSCQET